MFQNMIKVPMAFEDALVQMAEREAAELESEAAKFKRYVHQRLSAMGVPDDPDPTRTQETGCRIGSRLNYVNETIEAIESVRDDMWISVDDPAWSEETKRVVGDYAKRIVDALKMQAV